MDSLFVPLLLGCVVAVVSALGVVLAHRPIYSAVALLAHSLSLAALFAILAADMVAVGQVLIYSGAIVVLFLFVVTLLPAGGIEIPAAGPRVVSAVVAAVALAFAIGVGLLTGLPPAAATFDLTVAAVGRSLFGPLLIAFELTAPLLLVAIVSGVVIWRRHEPAPRVSVRPAVSREPRKLVLHR